MPYYSNGNMQKDLSVMLQTDRVSLVGVKNCNLDKHIRDYGTIKHQRDKQIIIAYLADIKMFSLKIFF